MNTFASYLVPGLLMMLGAFALCFLPPRWRDRLAIALPLFVLVVIWCLPDSARMRIHVLDQELLVMAIGAYSRLFGTAFCLAAFGGVLFAYGYNRGKELTFAFLLAGGALGAVFAGDSVTFFLFWEIMSIGSLLVIWLSGTDASRRAGFRYAYMHLFGGILMLTGFAMLTGNGGPIALNGSLGSGSLTPLLSGQMTGEFGAIMPEVRLALQLAAWLVLIGILVNLAAPPFSAWLADAYPEASVSGTIFLSAFTTKTAVFALLVLFPGADILMWIGLFMAFYGVIYGLLENDIRRTLCYSIVGQVGFMVVAIGVGSPLALLGAATHAFAHIIYKSLLMMSAGAVIQQTGKRLFTDLGGLYHSMRWTLLCGVIGALAISAFPFTAGFISKSMILEAAADEHRQLVWYLLLAASAASVVYVGLKFPWFVFFQRDNHFVQTGRRPYDPPLPMRMGMLSFAILCVLPGLWPNLVYNMLPQMPEYEPNTVLHWLTQMQLLIFSGLVFFLALPWLQNVRNLTLDMDWFWRVPLLWLLRVLDSTWSAGLQFLEWLLLQPYYSALHFLMRIAGPRAVLTRSVNISIAITGALALLGIYLLLFFTAI